MDDKQLNFNRPLLSVRRGLSTAVPEVDRRQATKPPPTIPPLPYYKSDLKSGPVRNPGVVPFQWEQIPGKPKDKNKLQNEAHEQPAAAPKLPPGKAMKNDGNLSDKRSQESVSVSDSSSLYKENAREENGSSVSEGDNSTYVDALDSLSHTDSFLNCSVTGVSGLDGPNTKPTETYSDPLARDLMMGRFLPAAKAVASETPHFGLKKQSIVKEKPREAMKVIPSDKQNPRYYYARFSLPQHPQSEEDTEEEEEEEEEEEDDDVDFGESENVSVKLCGLLPRICLLNPLPGIRDQVPRPISSVRQMRKKPAKAGAFNKTDKAVRDAVYERKRLAVYNKSDMRVGADRLKHELNELYPQSDIMKLNEAPFMKVSSNSLIPKEKQFLGIPEAVKDSSSSEVTSRRKAADVTKETTEKTLYIDSEQITEYRDSNSSSSESRGRNPSIDYSLHDIKDHYFTDNTSQSRNMDTGDSNMLMPQEMLKQEETCNRIPDADVQQLPNKDLREAIMDKNTVLPLLLPKSPSESWLSRALPSVSSRNSRSYGSTGNLGFRSSPVNPRWESVAQSSKLHNKHFGLPALTPISEN